MDYTVSYNAEDDLYEVYYAGECIIRTRNEDLAYATINEHRSEPC